MSIPIIVISDSEEEPLFGLDAIMLSDDESPPHTPQYGHPEEMYDSDMEPMNVDQTAAEDSEEESEAESTEDSEEEPEEEITPTPALVPSSSTRPRTLLNARKRVYSPPRTFASTSYASGSRTIRTARKNVHPPQAIFPPEPASPSPTPLSAPSSPLDEPHIPPPTVPAPPTSTPTHTYTSGEPYAPVHTHTAPYDPNDSVVPLHPPMSNEEWAWYQYSHNYAPDHHIAGTSTSAPPPPPTNEDQVHLVEHRTHQLSERVLAPGSMADHLQMLESRLLAMENERDVLRARVHDLEKAVVGILRTTK